VKHYLDLKNNFMALEDKDKRTVVSNILKEVKLHNAGYTPPKPKKSELASCGMYGNGVSYPSLYLNVKNAPEMKGYEAGEEVLLLVKGDITSHSLDERKDNSRETWDIQIKELACLNKQDKK
jgi:hypothetical protein